MAKARATFVTSLPVIVVLMSCWGALSEDYDGKDERELVGRQALNGNEESTTWAPIPAYWKHRLKGCDEYLDAASRVRWNETVTAENASRLSLEHPFLSLGEGIFANVSYTGESVSDNTPFYSALLIPSCTATPREFSRILQGGKITMTCFIALNAVN